MKRNCNLELQLVTPIFDHNSEEENYHQQEPMEVINGSSEEKQGENHKLTIFYDGRVCSCDVTQTQARSIISLASQEIVTKTSSCCSQISTCPKILSPKAEDLYKQNTSISMKRSLQQFLQKRRVRIQATSPYNR